jgi:hypothetical protein
MLRQRVIDVLNRLFAIQRFSLVNYLREARAWTHPGNESLLDAIRASVNEHDHFASRLAEEIAERDGCVESGSYPIEFTSLNDLALDYLLKGLVEHQQRDIHAMEQCAAELVDDTRACSLAGKALESERARLDIFTHFLPHAEPAPNRDSVYSRAA